METKDLPKYISVISDENVEKSVLGSIISYKEAYSEVAELLSEECFSTQLHKEVYSAITSLAVKCDPVDVITVIDELKRLGNDDYLNAFHVTQIASAGSYNYYYNTQILNDFRSRNRAYLIGETLSARAKDLTFDIADSVEESTGRLGDVFSIPSNDIATIGDAAMALYENHIKRNLSGGSGITGAPTGFKEFDEISGGLHPGNLIVVAAETAQGKTSFAMSMAVHAAKHNYPVAIYSLEMPKTDLFARMAACETGIPVSKLLYTQLHPAELKRFDTTVCAILNLPIYFDDKSTSNIDVIISSIRTMVAKRKIQGVVIDYLQILAVNLKGTNKEQQMAEVARRLKNLAKDLGIWIIALSQLNRDSPNHVPTLNRLRDSGQIAEAADIVVLLYRPEVYDADYPYPFKGASTKGTAMVNIAKGRNIGTVSFLLFFDAPTTRFEALTIPIPPTTEEAEAEEEPF